MENLKCLNLNTYSLSKSVYFNEKPDTPDASIAPEPQLVMGRRMTKADLKFEIDFQNDGNVKKRYTKILGYLENMEGAQWTTAHREKLAKGLLKYYPNFDTENKENQDLLNYVFQHFIEHPDNLSSDDVADIAFSRDLSLIIEDFTKKI
jgi:hypothetical protein